MNDREIFVLLGRSLAVTASKQKKKKHFLFFPRSPLDNIRLYLIHCAVLCCMFVFCVWSLESFQYFAKLLDVVNMRLTMALLSKKGL